eukprot:jgi/Orpsp1_1/1174124/evm.model.c7180000049017.1
MKLLFLFLLNILFVLILAQSSPTDTTTIDECQTYYSILGNNDGSCCTNENPNELSAYCICEDGYITKINIDSYFNEKEKKMLHFTELPNDIFKLKKLKELNLTNCDIEKIQTSIVELSELEI